MRIAYVCYWFLLDKDGVVYKIEGQVRRWRAAGNDVEVFCLTRPFLEHRGIRQGWRTFRFDRQRDRLAATRLLVAAVREWKPDLVYLRYDLFLPPIPRLLRAVASVVEVNADDKEEVRLRRRRRVLAMA